MKDSEFIELLNLYLDHEITPADAARLEAEVQGNPARHRIYQDYCRMQKACKLLTEDFATEPAIAPAHKVVPFDAHVGRTARVGPLYYVGGLAAAAACVAIIFVGRSRQNPDAESVAPAAAIAQVEPTPSAVAPSAPVQLVAATETTAPRAQRTNASGLSIRTRAQSEVLTLNPTVQNDPHFAWMQDVRLSPIQMPNAVDQLQFEVSPALRSDSRTFHSNKPLPAEVPWTAIRFQK